MLSVMSIFSVIVIANAFQPPGCVARDAWAWRIVDKTFLPGNMRSEIVEKGRD